MSYIFFMFIIKNPLTFTSSSVMQVIILPVSVSHANILISFTIVFVILVELKPVRLSYAQLSDYYYTLLPVTNLNKNYITMCNYWLFLKYSLL